jgi:aspartyl-tRNA(Asn)/glutamyl-tRNA(Gln) amidotransferase subunit A
VTPLSPSFDAVGPIARSATELGRLITALTGNTMQHPPAELRGLRVGVPGSYFFDELDAAVAHGCDELQLAFAEAGVRLQTVRLSAARLAADALAVLLNVEAAAQHARLIDDQRVDPQVRHRLALGCAASARERNAARRVYAHWTAQVAEAFEAVDVIVSPTVPFVAPAIGSGAMVELSRRINRCTSPWSLAPVPVLAVPLSAPAGLPVGGQLTAAPGRDLWLTAVGAALQARTDWHHPRPPIAP